MVSVDGGNSFRQATSLGTAVIKPNSLASVEITDALKAGSGETVDWFRFRVRGRASSQYASTSLVFAGDQWASSLTLYQGAQGKLGRKIARLDTVNSFKTLKPLTAGTYFIKVSGSAPPPQNAYEGYYSGGIRIFQPVTNLFK